MRTNPYPALMGRRGFPGSVVSLLIVLFVVSLVALLSWFAYYVFDAAFFGRPRALGALWITAMLSGSVALFSGLLAFHYEHEDYTLGEEVLHRVFPYCLHGYSAVQRHGGRTHIRVRLAYMRKPFSELIRAKLLRNRYARTS
jgi:hypothetical protein